LHAVQADLFRQRKRRRVGVFSDGPIARADLEAALFGAGQERRAVRGNRQSACRPDRLTQHFPAGQFQFE
jgi:hypothetical protein